MDDPTDYTDGSFDTNKRIDFITQTAFMQDENYNSSTLSLGGFNPTDSNIFEPAFKPVPRPEIILPSLQLATKFFLLPRVQKFFHALLGDLRLEKEDYIPNYTVFQHPKDRSNQGCEIRREEWDPDRILPTGEDTHAMVYLIKMMQYRMHLYEFSPDTQFAVTRQSDEDTDFRLFARVDRLFVCNGFESLTKLPQSLYDAIESATDDQDIPKLLWYRFELATTLIHELTHAARNCLSGKHDMEPFFGFSSVAEWRFELESMMYDGYFGMLYPGNASCYKFEEKESELSGALVLYEYPNRGVVQSYDGFGENAYGIGLRGDLSDLTPLDVAWRVPLKFLERFFDPEWWKGKFREAGETFPERRIGYCFRVHREPILLPVITSKNEEARYIPNGYYRNPATGDILPQNPNILVSDLVRTRLLSNANSLTSRTWITPYEPGGEYDGLPTTERRRREIIYRMGETLEEIQPGGRYELADSTTTTIPSSQADTDFSGHSELLLSLLIDGILNLPTKICPANTPAEALQHLSSLDKYKRADLADAIAKNNAKLIPFGFQEFGPPFEPEELRRALDVSVFGDILEGSFNGNPMEQMEFSYRTGIAFRQCVPGDAEWQLTEGFRPYSSLRAPFRSIAPLPTIPQGDITMEDDGLLEEEYGEEEIETRYYTTTPMGENESGGIYTTTIYDPILGRSYPAFVNPGPPSLPQARYPTIPQAEVRHTTTSSTQQNSSERQQQVILPALQQQQQQQQSSQITTRPLSRGAGGAAGFPQPPTASSPPPRTPLTTAQEMRILNDSWLATALANRAAEDVQSRQQQVPVKSRAVGRTVTPSAPARTALNGGVPLTGEQDLRNEMERWFEEGRRRQRVEREERERRARGEGDGGDGDEDVEMT